MPHTQTFPTSSFKVTVDHISSYAIFTMDLDGAITSWNAGARQIYGWEEAEILGRNVSTLYSAADNRRKIPARNLKRLLNRSVFEAEINQQKKDKSLFLAAITINPFVDSATDENIGYLQITKDITVRNQRESDQISDNGLLRTEIERRKLVENQLKLSNQELDAFASAASHDLQEPLRMVVSYLRLIERRYGDTLDTDGKEFLNFAVDGAERMKTLISDLVEYSRIDKLGKKFSSTDPNEVLRRVLSNMEVIIEENKATITADTLPVVCSDGVLLSQVFQNLLMNAIKFKADQPPVIHVTAKETKHETVFSFKDNGKGIEKKNIPIIFMIFKQLGDRASRTGSGVGLAIVKKIVNRHDGKVWVKANRGGGSTFYFSISKDKEQ